MDVNCLYRLDRQSSLNLSLVGVAPARGGLSPSGQALPERGQDAATTVRQLRSIPGYQRSTRSDHGREMSGLHDSHLSQWINWRVFPKPTTLGVANRTGTTASQRIGQIAQNQKDIAGSKQQNGCVKKEGVQLPVFNRLNGVYVAWMRHEYVHVLCLCRLEATLVGHFEVPR